MYKILTQNINSFSSSINKSPERPLLSLSSALFNKSSSEGFYSFKSLYSRMVERFSSFPVS